MKTAKALGVMICAVFLSLPPGAYAQTATGQVNGIVSDSSGGAIAGATVRLTNEGTNIVSQAETNGTGYYLFINVQPGSYNLSVEAKGFKSARLSGLNVAVNQGITQNIRMDVGAVSESVTVTAEAPLLQQSSWNSAA